MKTILLSDLWEKGFVMGIGVGAIIYKLIVQ